MYKKGSRLVAFLTATAIISLTLPGCTSDKPKPVAKEEVKKPTEFTVYLNYSWANRTKKWGETTISKELEKKLNCKINFANPDGNENEKLNVMIASNSLPDVIEMDRNADYRRLIDLDYLLPLDQYFEKYPNYRNSVDQKTANFSKVNGKMYSILNWSTKPDRPTGNGGWMINEKIYKQLGSPSLATTEDLFKYLVLLKSKNIKMNDKDVVPFQLEPTDLFGGFWYVYSSFGGIAPSSKNLLYPPQGTNELKFVLDDPRFEQTMIYVNKLWKAGLINKDYLVETAQQKNDKINSGRVGVYTSGSVVNEARTATKSWLKSDSEASYVMIDAPAAPGMDPKKIMYNQYNTLGWNSICITKQAKEPEKIYQIFDWIASPEGQALTFYGPKGILWDELDEGGYPILKKNRSELTSDEANELACEVYSLPGVSTWVGASKTASDNKKPPEKRDKTFQNQLKYCLPHSYNATAFEGLMMDPNSEEGLAFSQTRDYLKRTMTKMFAAQDEAEIKKLIKDCIDKSQTFKFNLYEKRMTSGWLKNKQILGME